MIRFAVCAGLGLIAAPVLAEGHEAPGSALLLNGFDKGQIIGVSPDFTASPIELLTRDPAEILQERVPDFTMPDSTRDGGLLFGNSLRGLDPNSATHARLVWIEIGGQVYCITETSTQDVMPDQ